MDQVTPIISFSSFLPITEMIMQADQQTAGEGESRASAVKNFDQLRNVLRSDARLLIMDLEFYKDPQKNQNCPAQIAGKMFEGHASFNYHLFGTNMPAERQVAFLRQYDLRFSETDRYQAAEVIRRIMAFVEAEQPDYIVSWDNSTDFSLLNREANRMGLPKDQRPWRTIRPLDLEKLVAKEVWNNKNAISLEKMCTLLHLPAVKHHRAQNDVKAIEQILKFYALDLGRELN